MNGEIEKLQKEIAELQARLAKKEEALKQAEAEEKAFSEYQAEITKAVAEIADKLGLYRNFQIKFEDKKPVMEPIKTVLRPAGGPRTQRSNSSNGNRKLAKDLGIVTFYYNGREYTGKALLKELGIPCWENDKQKDTWQREVLRVNVHEALKQVTVKLADGNLIKLTEVVEASK